VGMIFQIFVWRLPKGRCYGNQLNMGDMVFDNGLADGKSGKSPQKRRGYGQVTYLNIYFPLKDGGKGQFEMRKICTWKMQEQIALPI